MYDELKRHHRSIRDQQDQNLRLRIHRSLSWFSRAEQCDDADGRFIFLWIAFNAAYATDIIDSQRGSERSIFGDFFKKLCDLDGDKRLSDLVWQEFPSSIRVLLDNSYVNADFWEFQRGNIDREIWQKRTEGAKRAVSASLAAQNTPDTLAIIFSRIYVLRNQLVHGGATWDSAINRSQIRDCVVFLEKFVIEMLKIMMDGKPTLWGEACFPPVDQ